MAALRRVLLSVVAGSVMSAAACSPVSEWRASQSAAMTIPDDWSVALVRSPLDPWDPGARGELTLYDADGGEVWSQATTALQNQQFWTDGSTIIVPERDEDVVYGGRDGGDRVQRDSTKDAEVVVHAVLADDQGDGVVLFNNGFSETPRGYTFMATAFSGSNVLDDYSIDGFVASAWACSDRVGALVLDMTPPSEDVEAVPREAAVGHLSDGGFVEDYTIELPAGAEPVQGEVPCDGDDGLVLTATAEASGPDGEWIMSAMDLWRFERSEAHSGSVTGWADGPTPAILGSTLIDGDFVWWTLEGQVWSVPTAGGQSAPVMDLQFPDPVPGDMVMRVTENGAIVVAEPDSEGMMRLRVWDTLTQTEPRTMTLEAQVSDNAYFSDVDVRSADE